MRSAVLVLYAITVLFGGLAVASNYLSGLVTALLGCLLVLAIGFFGIYLGQVRIYTQADYEKIHRSQNSVGYASDLYVGSEGKRFLKGLWPHLVLTCSPQS